MPGPTPAGTATWTSCPSGVCYQDWIGLNSCRQDEFITVPGLGWLDLAQHQQGSVHSSLLAEVELGAGRPARELRVETGTVVGTVRQLQEAGHSGPQQVVVAGHSGPQQVVVAGRMALYEVAVVGHIELQPVAVVDRSELEQVVVVGRSELQEVAAVGVAAGQTGLQLAAPEGCMLWLRQRNNLQYIGNRSLGVRLNFVHVSPVLKLRR